MTAILLPELPKGKEFEEYISACLQVGGYYIERNIIEKEVEEVLELDIIASNYQNSIPELSLIEAKSGSWGFADLFKVYGWMHYLNLLSGIFIVNKDRQNLEFIKEKASKNLHINLTVIKNLSNCRDVLSNILNQTDISSIDETDVHSWRFAYWIERKLLEYLTHKKKSNQTMKCYKVLVDYYNETSSGIFFVENTIKRIDKLYSVFRDNPNITAKTGNELIGNNFEDDYKKMPDEIYRKAFFDCEYNDIQICTFLEHRARLAILKNTVDYILYKKAGNKKADDLTTKIFGIEFKIIDSLPASFKRGMNIISEHKYFHRYPIFWQWFMWLFGGFILEDYKDKEYELLSKKTGIPLDNIQNAFDSYQILFPTDGGWFMHPYQSKIWHMKLFPVPFMGIGANYRRTLHLLPKDEQGERPTIDKMQVTGNRTLNDLIKYNNLAVKVLSR